MVRIPKKSFLLNLLMLVSMSVALPAWGGTTSNVASGDLSHSQELFVIKGATLAIEMGLNYNSLSSYNGNLSLGWTHNYVITLTDGGNGSKVLRQGASTQLYLANGSTFDSQPGDTTSLTINDSGYLITYRDGLKQYFGADGKITSIADRFGNTLNFIYTGGDLTSISDSENRSLTIGYDTATTPHRLTTITDPNQNIYTLQYNTNGQLWKVVYPVTDSGVPAAYWEFTYVAGNLETKRDPGGNLTRYEYDTNGRVKTIYDPQWTEGSQGHTRSIVYPTTSGNIRTSTFTEKDGGLWTYNYEVSTGTLKEKIAPDDGVTPVLMRTTSYTYDSNGRTKSKTESGINGVRYTTFYTYDANGNTITESVPLDCVALGIDPATVANPVNDIRIKTAFRYSYETAGQNRILSSSDERGTVALTTSYAYTTDVEGYLVTTVTDPAGANTVTRQYTDGRTKDVIDANGKITSYTYRTDKQIETITDPTWIVTSFTEYDANANNTEMQIKDNTGTLRKTIIMSYDAKNRLRTTTARVPGHPDVITTYGYDDSDNQNYIKDAELNETRHEYNYNRQLINTTQYLKEEQTTRPVTTKFEYGATGCPSCGGGVDKLTAVEDAKQQRTIYQYDKLGRLEYETDPLSKKYHYTYYENGLLKEKYDATATFETLLITYTYNSQGQLTRKQYTDGSPDTVYDYDDNGRLQTASNGAISYTYAYYDSGTNMGRLQSVTDNTGKKISYDDYDNLGQRKQVTILKGSADQRIITYDYDTANRPWHITSAAGQFKYEYDTLGRRQYLTYPNQTKASYVYDDLDRLTSLTHQVINGPTLASITYPVHDGVGNRTTAGRDGSQWSYIYDDMYRFLEKVSPTQAEKFTYDDVGNRTSGPGYTDSQFFYSPANQVINGRRLQYGYDNAGNQTTRFQTGVTDKSWTQAWNYENRLVKVEKIKGAEKRTISFSYDPMGRRIGKQVTTIVDGILKTQTYTYVYDGENIAVEIFIDASGTTKTFYTHGAGVDEHLALERNGSFNYYHADGLGSITSITGASGNLVEAYEYDSFGMVKSSNNFQNSYTYTGREWDKDTGLYYYRARYYDPMEGRFISKDPISFQGGINIYAYVDNNSINKIDPLGLAFFAKRALAGRSWIDGVSNGNSILDNLNIEWSHEQLFFEDGKEPSNAGFFKTPSGGKVMVNESSFGYHRTSGSYDDCIMRKAYANVSKTSHSYCLIIPLVNKYNCQNWADDVRREYQRLISKKECCQ